MAEEKIENHLVLAIVSLCLVVIGGIFAAPAAIASVIFAIQTDEKVKAGDIEGAKQSGGRAKVFGWIAVALWAIPWILVILLVLVFGLAIFGAAVSAH